MNENTLEFIVTLRGGDTAASEMSRLRQEVSAAGGTIKRVGEQSAVASTGTGKLGGTVKHLAAAFVALGAGYKVYGAAKNAITYTKDLAEASKALTNATGLNINESSRYVGVAGALGISSGQLNVAFKSLATQTEKAGKATHTSTDTSAKNRLAKLNETAALESLEKRLVKGSITQKEYNTLLEKQRLSHTGTAAATAVNTSAFQKLGITQEWLNKHGKDFNAVILEVTKRLHAMPGSTEKTKIETELFGRSWAALNPLLGEGSDHLEHVLGLAKKFGVELHGGVTKELDQLREAQLESTLATDGLRIAFTRTAAKPMIDLLHGFAKMKTSAAEATKTGNWTKFNKELEKVFTLAGHLIERFEYHTIEGFGQLAPGMLKALWHGFQKASLPNKALMVGILATKFGLTTALFGALGKTLGTSIAGGIQKSTGWKGAGTKLGGVFGKAFAIGAAVIIGMLLAEYLKQHLHVKSDPKAILEGKSPLQVSWDNPTAPKGQTPGIEAANERVEASAQKNYYKHPFATSHTELGGILGRENAIEKKYAYLNRHHHPHAAMGANVTRSGLVEVGERGPEVLNLPSGASVTPLKPGSLADDRPMYLTVDGKVLARVLRRQAILSQAAGA